MVDYLTRQLFYKFPRECGRYRNVIYQAKDFENFINSINGIDEPYIALYGQNFMIDKIFFDFDYGPDVLGDTQKLFKYCLDQGWQPVPIITGKKGYHIYVPVAPDIHGAEARIRLLSAHFSIIEETFGEFKQETLIVNKKQVQVFRELKEDGEIGRIIGPDPAICGDVRRLGRVPNTLRPPENINYCTYVDPEIFLTMTELDVVDYMKSPHDIKMDIDFRCAPKLQDFNYEFNNAAQNFSGDWTPLSDENELEIHIPTKYIHTLIRPCLYRQISHMHPTNSIRYIVTLDLLSIGLSPESITSIYSTFGWEDFDASLTLDRIRWIKTKMQNCPEIYHHTSCNTLRFKGIPNEGECTCRWDR